MKVDDLNTNRFISALELFEEGHSFLYRQTSFYIEENLLYINYYSEYNHLENITEDIAKDGIKKSKIICEEIKNFSNKFHQLIKNKDIIYEYCYDYHTGAVAVAKERNNKFEWLK